MNKYLFNKIEQSHSAYFENLIFIANEVCKPKPSEEFEEFTQLEPKKIAKILGWNDKETTLKMIKESINEKDFSPLLLQNHVTGFIGKCHLPHHSNFVYEENQKTPYGSSVHCGVLRVDWVYAESIGELVEKLEKLAEDFYVESYLKEQSEK